VGATEAGWAWSYMVSCKEARIENDNLTVLVPVAAGEDVSYMTK